MKTKTRLPLRRVDHARLIPDEAVLKSFDVAIKKARETRTGIFIAPEGKIIRLTPEKARRLARKNMKSSD